MSRLQGILPDMSPQYDDLYNSCPEIAYQFHYLYENLQKWHQLQNQSQQLKNKIKARDKGQSQSQQCSKIRLLAPICYSDWLMG